MKNKYIPIISISVLVILMITHKLVLFDNLKNILMKRKTVSQVISNIEPSVKVRLHIDNSEQFDSLTLIGIKEDRKLECWVKTAKNWEFLKLYNFTGYSGGLGPKLRAGDGQIPEGIYKVEYLNPNSRYYLSIKLNYPNETDLFNAKKDNRNNPGDDIFIHGKDVTIGCIPIGDRQIEEVFYLVAKIGKNRTTIILTPGDFRKKDVVMKRNVEWIDKLYNTIAVELMNYQN